MRIELLEKLVLFASALAVLAVALAVGLLSAGSIRSGIPNVAVESELAMIDWLDAERVKKHGVSRPEVLVASDSVVLPTTGEGGGRLRTAPPAPTDYLNDQPGTPSPPGQEAIEGYPWLRKVEGVTCHRPKPMPRILHKKYQSFEDGFELAQQGSGEFVSAAGGESAYRVTRVDPNSILARRLGLVSGDKIVSVNGNPIGTSSSAGKALYEQLKNETHFAVLIERRGRRELLSFYVR